MSPKIYFAGSIRGGRSDALLYGKIVKYLQDNIGPVLTEHVSHLDVLEHQDEKQLTDIEIHDRDMDWMAESDVIVAEVTVTSLGVGYELGRAIAMGKPALCLFRPATGKRLSAMIAGAHNGTSFVVKNYEEQDVTTVLEEYFKNFGS